MKLLQKLVIAVPALVLGTQALAEATFFSRDGFRGESVTLDKRTGNFERVDFNDRASSVRIDSGLWEVCEHARFEGRCVMLRRGTYASLREVGLDNAISSARPVERDQQPSRPAGLVPPVTAPRNWPGVVPVVYDVPVTSAHAVMAPPQQRCWVEKEVSDSRSQPNVGGAVLGAVIGGVLGHQVGKGSGKDVATAGGAVAGAAIGANVGRDSAVVERDVQRCETVQSRDTAYWEVTYMHGGAERRVQMQSRPGRTIRINGNGEPAL